MRQGLTAPARERPPGAGRLPLRMSAYTIYCYGQKRYNRFRRLSGRGRRPSADREQPSPDACYPEGSDYHRHAPTPEKERRQPRATDGRYAIEVPALRTRPFVTPPRNPLMKQACVTLFTLLLAFSLTESYAETYTWTDTRGTVHFTGDPAQVPADLRKKVKILEDTGPPPAEAGSAAPRAAAADGTHKPGSAETCAGKTHAQWEKELQEREAAMISVRDRLVEISDLASKPIKKDERDKLLAEHASLLTRFHEMRAQYDQQIEIARKAGVRITIKQQ